MSIGVNVNMDGGENVSLNAIVIVNRLFSLRV